VRLLSKPLCTVFWSTWLLGLTCCLPSVCCNADVLIQAGPRTEAWLQAGGWSDLIILPWHNSLHHSSFLALTTVTSCSPAFLHLPWRLCSVYKMRLLDLCLTLTGGHISLQHYSSCIGCPSSTASSRSHHWCSTFYKTESIISRRPGCIQHGRLSTTSTQVITNQSCIRETDTDPIWQMCLLSLRSQYKEQEQSSSSSPQQW